jgi:hypothetical protein
MQSISSALLWKESVGVDLVTATHHGAVGLAAQAHGLKVLAARGALLINRLHMTAVPTGSGSSECPASGSRIA